MKKQCKEKKMEKSVCFECDEALNESESVNRHIYWRPNDDEGEDVVFCSEECETSFLEERTEFPFVECPHCERFVCYQNPNNGYEVQFQKWKDVDDEEEYVSLCRKCYQEAVIEHGQPRSDFEENGEAKSSISGGTWFDSDLLDGFMRDNDFENVRIASPGDAKKFNERALEHIDAGAKVMIEYGAMGIGGLEGYASVFFKKQEELPHFHKNERTPKKRKCE